ncbi:MAG: hypothetical protein ACOZAA_13745 [Pseudomonadota bacterium]
MLAIAALAAAGCAGGLKRFAPPGIVKYEEIAKDEPINPAIAGRIEEMKEKDGAGFPKLAEQPTKTPDGIAQPERAAMEAVLLDQRDALNEAIAVDKAQAAAERTGSPEESRDALTDAVAKDDALARRERGLPPRQENAEAH